MSHFEQYDNPAEDGGAASAEPVFESSKIEEEEINPENSFENEVRQFARDFFEKIYSKEEMTANIGVLFAVQDDLSRIAGCEDEWQKERKYTPKFREATRIFLDEMLAFCESQKNDVKIDEFLDKIREMFFSFSPNIATSLNLGQYFDFASRATRTNNIQVSLGDNINGEFTGNIGWWYSFDGDKDLLFESYNKSSIPERLDKLNLMEIIHAELIGAGNAYNYRGGDTKIDLLLRKIQQNDDNAFIHYYVDIVKNRFKKEYQNPSKGIIHWTNDPGNARLWQDLTQEQWDKSLELKNTIITGRSLKRGEKFAQIAENVVAILNHANIPTEYAQIDLVEDDKKEANFIGFDELIENNRLKDTDIKDAELLFQHLYRPEMRERIENEFGVKLNDLPFHYHFHFLKFLSGKTIDEAENVKSFLNQSQAEEGRKNRIKSFLSLEAGREMSNNIFNIGEALEDQGVADAIFAKYAEIVDSTDQIREELSEMFKEKERNISQAEVDLISQNLLARANKLLVDFSGKVKITKNPEDILSELENYKADLLLTASVYKSFKELNTPIDLKDFEGVVFKQLAASEVNEADKKQMMEIYARNYADRPALQEELLAMFSDKISSGGDKVRIYLYKKGNEIIAFNRIDDNGEEGKYFASCNVRPEISGSCIGGALIKASLDKETANGEVAKADCHPGLPITSFYIEEAEFVGKGATGNYKNSGEPALNIERSIKNEKYYYRKNYDSSKIIAEYELNFAQNKYGASEERIILKFPKNSPDLLEKTEELTGRGYVMTRYVFDEKKEYAYCGFERGLS